MARSNTRTSGAASKTTQKSTKKTSTRKTPAKKTPAKKTAPKKTPAKKTAARKDSGEHAPEERSGRSADAPRAEPGRRPGARQVAAHAAAELLDLTGKSAEGITGLERTEEGWTVQVEVVEVHRIPNTTDVLALYEVQADERGSLLGYRRVKRYARGAPGEE